MLDYFVDVEGVAICALVVACRRQAGVDGSTSLVSRLRHYEPRALSSVYISGTPTVSVALLTPELLPNVRHRDTPGTESRTAVYVQ